MNSNSEIIYSTSSLSLLQANNAYIRFDGPDINNVSDFSTTPSTTQIINSTDSLYINTDVRDILDSLYINTDVRDILYEAEPEIPSITVVSNSSTDVLVNGTPARITTSNGWRTFTTATINTMVLTF